MNLITYLMHRATWEKLPRMPGSYSTEYNRKDVDPVTAKIMQMSHVRSPHGVRLLMKKYGATTPQELLDLLPSRRRPRRILAKLVGVFRRAIGVTPYDPMVKIAREHQPTRARRTRF